MRMRLNSDETITEGDIQAYLEEITEDKHFAITKFDTWRDSAGFARNFRIVAEEYQEVGAVDDISMQSSGDSLSVTGQATMELPRQAQVAIQVPDNASQVKVYEWMDKAVEKLEKKFRDPDFEICGHEIIRENDTYECITCGLKQHAPVSNRFCHERNQAIIYAALSVFEGDYCHRNI